MVVAGLPHICENAPHTNYCAHGAPVSRRLPSASLSLVFPRIFQRFVTEGGTSEAHQSTPPCERRQSWFFGSERPCPTAILGASRFIPFNSGHPGSGLASFLVVSAPELVKHKLRVLFTVGPFFNVGNTFFVHAADEGASYCIYLLTGSQLPLSALHSSTHWLSTSLSNSNVCTRERLACPKQRENGPSRVHGVWIESRKAFRIDDGRTGLNLKHQQQQ